MPVLRADSELTGRDILRGLHEFGYRVFEVTMTTPGALHLIAEVARWPDVLIGAGTVLAIEQATAAEAAGAQFLVSAVNPPFLIPYGAQADVLVIPGAATPNEVWSAWSAGAPAVKVFPVRRLGGAAYIRDLRGPLASLQLMASGGIKPEDVESLRDAGALVVGINAASLAGDSA